jgi:hypothetical protein
VPVLLLKGIDGSLRYSVHRITGELVYLPIPSSVRARVKPLIDGALGRTSQALTGAGLIALGGTSLLSPRPFVALVTVLAAAWLIVAMSMRRPYLELLRHAISTGSLNPQVNPDPLDLESAELLVQHLASEDPLEIVGALNALSRRGREGLVSALVLLHTDEMVLTQALDMFGASSRTDWMKLARRLLADERETVRMAAARAFALRDGLDPDRLANDVGPRVRAYAAVHLALRDSEGDVVAHPRIVTLMAESGEDGDAVRLGMLAALADVPPTSRLSSLLLMLVDRAERLPGGTELVARAAARQGELRLIPRLVSFLSVRTGREAVRTALVALGEPALDEVWRTLGDPARDHSLRIHMPKTLARFGTKRAAEYLLSSIETEQDGFVRYKSIRALGVLVLERNASLERARIERISHAHLVRHFGILAVRSALGPPKPDQRRSAAERLLVGLLDDKLRQSLERAFQLLKIAHPREEIRRVHLACLSDDVYARANAGEFLDTLLRSRNQQPLRNLLRLIADDLPVSERVDRAAPFVPHRRPKGPEEALAALVEDRDPTVAALARLLVSTPGGATAPGVALSRNQRDPEVFDA